MNKGSDLPNSCPQDPAGCFGLARVDPVLEIPVATTPRAARALTPLEIVVAQHALAIIQCEIGVEMWLRKNTEKEITHIIAETRMRCAKPLEAHTYCYAIKRKWRKKDT